MNSKSVPESQHEGASPADGTAGDLERGPSSCRGETSAANRPPRDWWTLPNAICLGRLIGSVVLVVLAATGWDRWFVGLFLLLALSDWVDGKLAIWLGQRSLYGSRLDSAADVGMYAALAIGTAILEWQRFSHEWIWLGSAFFSYACSVGYGLAKFGVIPTYHTRLAKTCWLLMTVGALLLLLNLTLWPFRLALGAIVLANVEAIAITRVSERPPYDIPSLYHVLRRQRSDVADE